MYLKTIVLKGEVADRIKELLIQLDHVHLMVRMRPDVSVSKMVQLFKGMTSKVVREEFSDLK